MFQPCTDSWRLVHATPQNPRLLETIKIYEQNHTIALYYIRTILTTFGMFFKACGVTNIGGATCFRWIKRKLACTAWYNIILKHTNNYCKQTKYWTVVAALGSVAMLGVALALGFPKTHQWYTKHWYCMP